MFNNYWAIHLGILRFWHRHYCYLLHSLVCKHNGECIVQYKLHPHQLDFHMLMDKQYRSQYILHLFDKLLMKIFLLNKLIILINNLTLNCWTFFDFDASSCIVTGISRFTETAIGAADVNYIAVFACRICTRCITIWTTL